jgi:tetratricopeptide (TPR) repeat protein
MPTPSPRLALQFCTEAAEFERRSAWADSEARARRALNVLDSLMPDRGGKYGPLLQARALGLLGTALRQLGRYTEAEPHLVRAIALAETMPERPFEAAIAWNNLGMVCKYVGWYQRGEDAYSKALSYAGENEEITATVLHNIGGLYHSWGRFEEGESPAHRAWEIRRRLRGQNDPATLADAVAYAGVLDGLKRYGESRPIYERALEVYERAFGPVHFEVASTLHNLAMVEAAEGHRDRAVELARRTWEMKVHLLGEEHPETALSGMNLAVLTGGADDDSRRLLETALQVFERCLQPGHPRTERCRKLLG